MSQFHELLRSLGGLHDAVPIVVIWKHDERRLELKFKDLHANFKGLPEYKGAKQGSVFLHSVELVELQLNLTVPGLKVYDWATHALPDGSHQSVVTFSPEGKIIANYKEGAITPCANYQIIDTRT